MDGAESESSGGPEARPDSYWERRLAASEGLEGVGVTALGPGFNRWAYRARAKRFDGAAAPLIARFDDPRVLDVGAGSGFYVDRWGRFGCARITAADLTETAVERLRRAHPSAAVVRLDIGAVDAIEAAGLEPGGFELISAMDVLFHILDDDAYRRAFANLAALLAPGGYLIFSEDMIRGRRSRRRAIKVTRPAREVRRSWRAAGLELISIEPLFVLMNFPAAGGRRWRRWWAALSRTLEPRPWLGGPVGALLYPLERLLVGRIEDGPSTKLIVLRRPPEGAPQESRR